MLEDTFEADYNNLDDKSAFVNWLTRCISAYINKFNQSITFLKFPYNKKFTFNYCDVYIKTGPVSDFQVIEFETLTIDDTTDKYEIAREMLEN